jgi:hypothetical protein
VSEIEKETRDAIKGSGHDLGDIIFIGSLRSGHSCTWNEFVELAAKDDAHYYSGYGGQTLALDLVIAFSDQTYMTRWEYDGSESWEYNVPLKIPTEVKPITTICNGELWSTLEDMNQPGGKYGEVAS